MKKTWFDNHYPLVAVTMAVMLIASITWTLMGVQQAIATFNENGNGNAINASLGLSLDYQVVSQKDLLLWPKGTILDPDSAAYFYAADPLLAVMPSIDVKGLIDGQFTAQLSTQASLQAVNDKGVVYWSYPLVQMDDQQFDWQGELPDQVSGLGPDGGQFLIRGEKLEVEIQRAKDMAGQISEELDFQSALYQVVVEVNMKMAGLVNGVAIDRTFDQSLPVTLLPSTFSAPLPKNTALEVPLMGNMNPEGTLKGDFVGIKGLVNLVGTLPLPFAVVGLLVVALLVLTVRNLRGPSKHAQEHKRYQSWITEGRVDTGSKLQIAIVTLEGLVDLAIDLDKRVIHDASSEKYFVLTDDLVYVLDMAKSEALLENKPQLGKLLLEKGIIRPDQLETGLYYQQKLGSRLGESLMALGFVDEVTLYSALASQQGVDYIELDMDSVLKDIAWVENLDVQKARALQVLPLGVRSDGKWVVASSEPSKPGVQQALRESLGAEVFMTATRPSGIYEALESITAMTLKLKGNQNEVDTMGDLEPLNRLTTDEQHHFKTAYLRGTLVQPLLLKAAGLPLPNAMGSKQGEVTALLKGIDKAVATMDWQSRQRMEVPELLVILQGANFMTPETLDWAQREAAIQQVSVSYLLAQNHLAGPWTLKIAEDLLHTLENLIEKIAN